MYSTMPSLVASSQVFHIQLRRVPPVQRIPAMVGNAIPSTWKVPSSSGILPAAWRRHALQSPSDIGPPVLAFRPPFPASKKDACVLVGFALFPPTNPPLPLWQRLLSLVRPPAPDKILPARSPQLARNENQVSRKVHRAGQETTLRSLPPPVDAIPCAGRKASNRKRHHA